MKIRIKAQAEDPAITPVCYGDRFVYLRAEEPMDFKPPVMAFDTETLKNVVTFDEGDIALEKVTITLPKGYEAQVRLHKGLITTSTCTMTEPWVVSWIALKEVHADKGDIIGMIEVYPSVTATFWQKIKWLFSDCIEIISE